METPTNSCSIPGHILVSHSFYALGLCWKMHALGFSSTKMQRKKGSKSCPVALARGCPSLLLNKAAAEHPQQLQHTYSPRGPGKFKWQGLSLRVTGEAKGKSNTNKTSPPPPSDFLLLNSTIINQMCLLLPFSGKKKKKKISLTAVFPSSLSQKIKIKSGKGKILWEVPSRDMARNA